MASVITHSLLGFGIAYMMPQKWRTNAFMWVATIAPSLPDLDVLGFYAGVPYESFFGHRGFFHSLFFSFLLATFLALLVRAMAQKMQEISFIKLVLCLGSIISSHGILDAMTTGGHGIALFSPFYDARIFLPWRVIRVSPMHISAFLGEWGIRVILSEILYVWLPLSFVVAAKKIMFSEK